MNFTEEKVFEAFGLEVPDPSGTGANGQGVAEPEEMTEPGTGEAGARAQEIAEPARVDTEDADQSQPAAAEAEGEKPQEGDKAAKPEKPAQTPDQRRENAARRRAQEQQTAIDQAVSAALQAERERNDAVMQEFFSKAGIRNPATGETIRSMEEFQNLQEQLRTQQLEQQLKSGKFSAEVLNEAIANHPAVKQAEQLRQQREAAQQQEEQAQARARIEAEIAEISKLDPSIQSVADLLNMPNAKEFRELVNRGYSFKDAHYVLNRDKIEQARTDAVRQQAMNNVQSKDHLKAVGSSRGSGAVAVPESDMKWFRAFNPHASDAEIQAYYNKHQKQ